LKDFPTEKSQWAEVGRLQYRHLLNRSIGSTPTFGELAEHFRVNELKKASGIGKKADETITILEHNLDAFVIPRWGASVAREIEPLQIEDWLVELNTKPQGKGRKSTGVKSKRKKKKKLAWPTIGKIRSAMSSVFKHAQRHGFLPAQFDEKGRVSNPVLLARSKYNSTYKAVVVEPEQMIVILEELDTPETLLEWTLTVVHATTALRPEECFALKWSDIDWKKQKINIQRAWSKGKETPGKNEGSMTQVPMHPLVAECLLSWRKESLYHEDDDWVFASVREKGRIPRSASTAAKDYLRPAMVKAGVIPEGYKGRAGWHNLRHSLATYLGANEVNLPVIQSILRHAKLSTTVLYTHGVNSAQLAAQGQYLAAIGMTQAKE
jgi:integrase